MSYTPSQRIPSQNTDAQSAAPRILIGWMTAPDRKTALSLAKAAVEAGLAACAQISEPILSLYCWDGALCEETEYRVTFKLTADAEPQLRALLVERHPYEVPQWLAVEASYVLPEYAAWVAQARNR